MPTVVEALTDATAELHNAALLYQNRADQVAAQLASFKNSAQTTINNYVNRAPSISVYVDENNGVDAEERGGTIETPFKTLDYALAVTDKSVLRGFYLLSDVTLRYNVVTLQAVSLVGIVKANGAFGVPFAYTMRKLKFAPEAFDSPRFAIGRGPSTFDAFSGGMTFLAINIELPKILAAMDYAFLIAAHGGNYLFDTCLITGEDPGGRSYLINPVNTRSTFSFFNTSLGANAPGRVFQGVPAGGDPRTSFVYETNLASA